MQEEEQVAASNRVQSITDTIAVCKKFLDIISPFIYVFWTIIITSRKVKLRHWYHVAILDNI